MELYTLLTILGLSVAAFVNLYQPRALLLVFIAAFFLVFVGALLPDPALLADSTKPFWFGFSSLLELCFIGFALATRAKQALALALFSVWNIFGNTLGLYSFYADGRYDDAYQVMIRYGEISQIIALTLLSRPILQFAAWYRSKARDHDSGYQFTPIAR